jgi:predicted aminopeptidase
MPPRRWLWLLSALLWAGCSPVYVMKSAAGHAGLLWRRRPIASMLADPAVAEPVKIKLRLIQEIRAFAFDEIGLRRTRDYSSVSKVHGAYVTYVVSASAKTRFKRHEWWFPFVGRVPYKGFFKERDARREADRLDLSNSPMVRRPDPLQ